MEEAPDKKELLAGGAKGLPEEPADCGALNGLEDGALPDCGAPNGLLEPPDC